jgi:Phosphopantetheine attachment site
MPPPAQRRRQAGGGFASRDRAQRSWRAARANLAGTYVAPRDALEEIVAGVWRDVLNLEQVGAHANFSELGGNSRSAIHVISEINRRLRVSVSVLELFKNPTVAQMRRLIISQQPSNKRRPTVVVLQDGQSQLPVYFIARARSGQQDRQLHGVARSRFAGFSGQQRGAACRDFAQHRRDNIDLSGVAVIDPQLTLLPQIEANGMMRMAGFFPSVPTQVNFEAWSFFCRVISGSSAAPYHVAIASRSPPPSPPTGFARGRFFISKNRPHCHRNSTTVHRKSSRGAWRVSGRVEQIIAAICRRA